MTRTYGAIERTNGGWKITEMEPHVALRFKAIFPRIPRTGRVPFVITGGDQVDADLMWFMQRFPLRIADADREHMTDRKTLFEKGQAELGFLLSEHWKPSGAIAFRDGESPYLYQSQAAELCKRKGGLLLMDDLGLGKTVSALATICDPTYLPALVVPPTHLVRQWVEKTREFTHLDTHIIKGTTPYELPKADVYICPYSKLAGWIDYAEKAPFKSVVFDEIQDLRNGQGTAKGRAAWAFRQQAILALGLSATPIYNYGSEIFQIVQFIEEGALGSWEDFVVEWCRMGPGGKWIVKEPAALGTFLRENHLALRRTNEDVGKEYPPANVLTPLIPYDEKVLDDEADAMRALAQRVVTGAFTDRGMAAREFDLRMRQATGVAKAPHVAQFVKMLLDAGEPVLLLGWHRECFAAGTPVLMRDGSIKAVEDVAVGDAVMGPDGHPRAVKSLVRGHGTMYRISPNKGKPWVCSENHVLVVRSERGAVTKMTAKQYAALSPRRQRSFTLFRSECIEFGGDPVLEPWLIGYWLGDGASDLREVRVLTDDAEVVLECGLIAARNGLSISQYDAPGVTGRSTCKHVALVADRSGTWGRNKLLNYLRSLGLQAGKHIPLPCKVAPAADRREMLAGLLDADGYVHQGNGAGTAEFTNKNADLADGVAFVARSLGLAATISHEDKRTRFSSGVERYYRVTISGDLTQLPMRIGRKRAPVRRQIKNVLHTGFGIEKIEAADFFGFVVDRDHLFLLGDFTVVHNCYDIWLNKLAAYNPLLYTGSESPAKKEATKRAFMEGRTNLMILSLRSGAGLDGLQHRCHTIVFGELDWSPKVHEQCVGRLRRPGQTKQVDAVYLHTDGGSDPSVMGVLGLKASQSHGIVDPLLAPTAQHSDATRIRELAERFLNERAAGAPMPTPPPLPVPIQVPAAQHDLFAGEHA